MRFQKALFFQQVTGSSKRLAVPIMTAPGIELIGARVGDVYLDAELQFRCIDALCHRFSADMLVTFMDLTVEAEAFGCKVQNFEAGMPDLVGKLLLDANACKTLSIPPVGSGRTTQMLNCAAKCAAEFSRPVLAGMIGPFSLGCRLVGMTEMLMLCIEEPDLAHLLLHKTTQFCSQYLLAIKETGVAGVLIAEPAAGLVSPDMCQEFAADYLQEMIVPSIDSAFLVILHNCGKTERQIAPLLSTGADALHVGNAVDILDILPQVPSNCLVLGNLDPVGILKNASPDGVYRETMGLLQRTAPWPHFILSTGCDVPPNVCTANLEAFFQARDDYNRNVTNKS